MTRQKNKVLTFFFSLIPGAGQMYLGFMKRGLSLILYVVAIACVTMILSMPELTILIPPVWMYAFFDAINLNGSDEENFSRINDEYITFDLLPGLKNLPSFTYETKKIWGKGLIFTGIAFLCYNILTFVGEIAFFANLEIVGYLINDVLNYSPRLVVGCVLIIMGKSLIAGNRHKENEMNFSIFVEEHTHEDSPETVEAQVVTDEPEYEMHEIIIPSEMEEKDE